MNSIVHYPGDDCRDPSAVGNAGSKPIQRVKPIIKVYDIAYLLFEKPDLDKQVSFLEDFGMHVAQREEDTVYLRGNGPSPWFYCARRGGTSRLLGAGYLVRSRAELETISAETGNPIEAITEPGGGERVRLRDPDGFSVDIVHGRASVERLDCRERPFPVNTPAEKQRVNCRVSTPVAPSPLERLGHFVLAVTDFGVSQDWYMRHLGIIPGDVQCCNDGTPVLAFNRCDRGDEPADHHTLVLLQYFNPGIMHSAYETLDLDALGQGNQHLRSRGWDHHWGIGRHILGSQLFDYWKDPWGDELEHYADGDMFDASYPTQYHPFDQGSLWSWGDDVPLAPKPGIRTLLSLLFGRKGKQLPRNTLMQMAKSLGLKPRPWY